MAAFSSPRCHTGRSKTTARPVRAALPRRPAESVIPAAGAAADDEGRAKASRRHAPEPRPTPATSLRETHEPPRGALREAAGSRHRQRDECAETPPFLFREEYAPGQSPPDH